MSKNRIYLSDTTKNSITQKPLIHKIKSVLRKEPQDEIFIFDGQGNEFKTEIVDIKSGLISLGSFKLARSAKKKSKEITLAFSLLKAAKTDFLLQKATELGVDTFIPFISQHSVARKVGASKFAHWKTIIIEASAQSQRLFLPKLEPIIEFDDLCRTLSRFDHILVAETAATKNLKDFSQSFSLKSKGNLLLVIGPEGGFSSQEKEKLSSIPKVQLVKISNFILRSETAAVFLAGVAAHYCDKNEI